MKAIHVVALAIVVSIATSTLTGWLVSRDNRDPENSADAEPGHDMAAQLDAIRREQASLHAAVKELRTSERPSASSNRSSATDSSLPMTSADIEEIVARVLKDREEMVAAPPSGAAIDAAMQRLLNLDLGPDEKQRVWDELIAKGQLDAVVAEFERRAEAAPYDSVAQSELGVAYHQKMRSTGGGPEAGKWGRMGSEAYARALELDETNWDARFAQAQHFYYADMKSDALRHLDTLREQQRSRIPEDRHSGAYMFLGNMYADQGNVEEAKKVWAEGLAIFPTNAELQARLAAFP